MKELKHLTVSALLIVGVAGCAGRAYLPGEPGGARSDISGLDVRQDWAAAHPEVGQDISEAILEGVFVPGMTLDQRDVVTNPKRKGSTGNGFWRLRVTGDETRYQWFVSGQREPFVDGRGRSVCELVFVDAHLIEVRYCTVQEDAAGG